MTQHVWESRRLTYTTIARGVGAYREARTGQGGSVPLSGGTYCLAPLTDDGSYRQAFMFAGHFLERYRQEGSISAWALWAGAVRYGHRYARGANAGNYETVGRRVLCAALVEEWRVAYPISIVGDGTDGVKFRVLLVPGVHEPLLGALLGAFEEAGAWQPLRDYLEERGYDRMINLLETGHPERVPSPGPLGGGIPVWTDGNPLVLLGEIVV